MPDLCLGTPCDQPTAARILFRSCGAILRGAALRCTVSCAAAAPPPVLSWILTCIHADMRAWASRVFLGSSAQS